MSCVPLFLISTGYLMKSKSFSGGGYYSGILRTLSIYLTASLACLIYRTLGLNESLGLKECISMVLGFSASNYAWYVEMYFGLFLIIPFINVMYAALKTQKKRLALIGTLIMLVRLPAQFNLVVPVFPDFWSATLYPILYYVIGAYLRDYEVVVSKACLVVAFALWVTLCSGINIVVSVYFNNGTFIFNSFNGWESIEVFVLSIMAFLLLYHLKMPTASSWGGRAIALVSRLSLGTYLMSWMVDSMAYPTAFERIGSYVNLLPYFIPIVALIFSVSLALSAIVTFISSRLLVIARMRY